MSDEVRLIIPPDITSEVHAILLGLGCAIELYASYAIVQLPAGTQRNRIFPSVTMERYTLHLPDGTTLREVYNRFDGRSILFLPRALFATETSPLP